MGDPGLGCWSMPKHRQLPNGPFQVHPAVRNPAPRRPGDMRKAPRYLVTTTLDAPDRRGEKLSVIEKMRTWQLARYLLHTSQVRFTAVTEKGSAMLYYALVFLVVALVAGLLGFGFVAFAAAEIARICFFVFVVLFLVSLLTHFFRRASNS